MPGTPADLPQSGTQAIVHATTVAVAGRGLLIAGPSGSGKSTLALDLMAHGAGLVADDRTILTTPDDGPPLAAVPAELAGLIEARGLGLLSAEPAPPARVIAVIDLGQVEADRLPPVRSVTVLDRSIPCLHKIETPHFASALLQYLKGGRSA